MRRLANVSLATLTAALLLITGAFAVAPAVHAQAGDDLSELARLREARELEVAGDLAGAERLVSAVLEANPTSLSALITLERLLSVQGRPGDVLPAVDRLLAVEPASAIGHQTRLRAQARLGDAARIAAAADDWIRAAPHLETPYRESALVWRERDETSRAIAVLEQGRRRIDRPDALALELGDAHAAAGEMRRAVSEWARAVGPDGRGSLLVQRRLQSQPDAGASAIPLLVESLAGPASTTGRRRVATLLAIDAGLEVRALALAQELAAGASVAEREQALVELARRADGAGLFRLAAWSYGELLRSTRDAGAGLAIRARVGELALMAGDTALAAAMYGELEHAAAAGSPQRRHAMAVRLALSVRDGDLARGAAQVDSFRLEYPHAPELDAIAGTLAVRQLDAGDLHAAGRTLAGLTGPRAAQARARMHIRGGDVDLARDALLAAAPQLQGREATESIALAALLSRTTPLGGELVARAVAAGDDDGRAEAVRSAVEQTAGLAAGERAAVLDFLAGLADASGLSEDADALRREIVESLPRSHEAAGALLALARRALDDQDAHETARVLLERLIVEYPRSTLAPQARRELDRLRGRGLQTTNPLEEGTR
jgi:tetratricopeptide (TPR) repeat protein